MSAIKAILVHLDASPRCEARLRTASRLADQHGAELLALYGVVPQALQFPVADGMSAQLLEEMGAADVARQVAVRSIFDQAVAAGLKRAKWLQPAEDLFMRDVARQALYADLLVLGQRERSVRSDLGLPPDFVESVLIDSGKPAVVVPYIGTQDSLGRTVMIAWKETRETARAVAAALPVLQQAERVHVATWGEENAPERRRMPELVHYLQRHGITASQHHYGSEPGIIGEFILSAAADLSADLLVMGAYGHSRAREWVLGGATRTILESMTVPVMFSH